MPRKYRSTKKKRANSIQYFEAEGKYWHACHQDKHHAWIVEFDKGRKNVGGGIKKVPISFLESREMLILAI
jgi:hypothetical protein